MFLQIMDVVTNLQVERLSVLNYRYWWLDLKFFVGEWSEIEFLVTYVKLFKIDMPFLRAEMNVTND